MNKTERMKAWREANKEKVKEYQKRYREANKERLKRQDQEYREANSERIKEREKEYREANKEQRSKVNKAWRKENEEKVKEANKKRYHEIDRIAIQESPKLWLKSKLKKIRKRKGLSIDHLLSLLEKQNGKCAISGIVMTTTFEDHAAISIDRIDSNVGYEPGNVQLVCTALNLAKKHHSHESIVEFVRMIREVSS